MHICIVNDYSIEHIGGAVSSMFEQKKALEAAGHTVTILQLGKKPATPPFSLARVVFVPPSFYLPKSLYHLPLLLATNKRRQFITELIKKTQPDVIHLQSEMSLARLTQSVAATLKIPTVFTVHTFFWQYTGPAATVIAKIIRYGLEVVFRQKIPHSLSTGNVVERTLKDLTLSVAQSAQAVISPSAHQCETMQRAGLVTPTFIVPNPFSPPDSKLVTRLTVDKHKPLRLLWIGRCEPEKRPFEFIEALRIAQKKSVRFSVDFVGEGSLLSAMRERTATLKVTFHGKIPHHAIIDLIDANDLSVLSSYHFDNQPMTVAESLSRARGVLYCDEQLKNEIGSGGYLTNEPTPESMAMAIIALEANREQVLALSEAARKQALLFSAEHFARGAEAVYDKVTKTHSK